LLRAPNFVYLYPGESSRKGAFTDLVSGRAAHRVLAQGSYKVSDVLEYRNISVYIQAVMAPVTKLQQFRVS